VGRRAGVRRGENSRQKDTVTSAKTESSCLSIFLIKGYVRKFQSSNTLPLGLYEVCFSCGSQGTFILYGR